MEHSRHLCMSLSPVSARTIWPLRHARPQRRAPLLLYDSVAKDRDNGRLCAAVAKRVRFANVVDRVWHCLRTRARGTGRPRSRTLSRCTPSCRARSHCLSQQQARRQAHNTHHSTSRTEPPWQRSPGRHGRHLTVVSVIASLKQARSRALFPRAGAWHEGELDFRTPDVRQRHGGFGRAVEVGRTELAQISLCRAERHPR